MNTLTISWSPESGTAHAFQRRDRRLKIRTIPPNGPVLRPRAGKFQGGGADRAALAAHDEGRPDDGLLDALQRAFGVSSAERLARAVNDEPAPENWAPRSPAVFAAADGGSALAAAVIDTAAGHLATLVSRLVGRGAAGDTVVAAGSVIVRQPQLARAFRTCLARQHPGLTVRILDEEPVAGAVVLARRLLATVSLG